MDKEISMEFTSVIIFMGFCMFGPMLLAVCTIRPEPEILTREVVKYKRVKSKKSNKKKPILVINNEASDSLKEDCIQCLKSLGMKKSDAKEKVEQMWKNKNYNSIESFLIDAYRV
jgi:hypothetical protein